MSKKFVMIAIVGVITFTLGALAVGYIVRTIQNQQRQALQTRGEEILKKSEFVKELALISPDNKSKFEFVKTDGDVAYFQLIDDVYAVGTITQDYAVNTKTGVITPGWSLFPKALAMIKATDVKRVSLPSVDATITLPASYAVSEKNNVLQFAANEPTRMAFYCMDQKASPYCNAYKKYVGEEAIKAMGTSYATADVRIVPFAGTPYEWTLDNVVHEGRTMRQLIASGEESRNETVQLGKKAYYKVYEGCCGDPTYSYITTMKDRNGNPVIVIFRGFGQYQGEGKKRSLPALESLLVTVENPL